MIFGIAARLAGLTGLYPQPVLNCFRIKWTTQIHREIVNEERKRKRGSVEPLKSHGLCRLIIIITPFDLLGTGQVGRGGFPAVSPPTDSPNQGRSRAEHKDARRDRKTERIGREGRTGRVSMLRFGLQGM